MLDWVDHAMLVSAQPKASIFSSCSLFAAWFHSSQFVLLTPLIFWKYSRSVWGCLCAVSKSPEVMFLSWIWLCLMWFLFGPCEALELAVCDGVGLVVGCVVVVGAWVINVICEFLQGN